MDGYILGKDVINVSSQQSYSQHKSGQHRRRQATRHRLEQYVYSVPSEHKSSLVAV